MPRKEVAKVAYFNIAKIIREQGLIQYKVAERAGLTEHRLSKIINGRAVPTEAELKAIAKVLGVKTKELEADAS